MILPIRHFLPPTPQCRLHVTHMSDNGCCLSNIYFELKSSILKAPMLSRLILAGLSFNLTPFKAHEMQSQTIQVLGLFLISRGMASGPSPTPPPPPPPLRISHLPCSFSAPPALKRSHPHKVC